MKLKYQFVCLFILFNSLSVSACPEETRHNKNKAHRTPPPEAFEACLSAEKGDSCEVTTPNQKVLSGTCRIPPRQEALVCVPQLKRPDLK